MSQPDVLNLDDSAEPLVERGYQLPTVLMKMAREYFTAGQGRWIPQLKDLVYLPGETLRSSGMTKTLVDNSLEIGRYGEYRGDAYTLRPKLLFRREAVARVPRGLAHGLRMSPSGPHADGQGGEIYEQEWSGSIVIFCLSLKVGESDLLGWDVKALYAHFEAKIAKDCTLSKFQASQIGTPGLIKEYPQHFATPVVLDYAYRDNVRIQTSQFPIREITVDVSQ